MDEDKVLNGLECCSMMHGVCCSMCPYYEIGAEDVDYIECNDTLCKDSYELIKLMRSKINVFKMALEQADTVDYAISVLRRHGWKEER